MVISNIRDKTKKKSLRITVCMCYICVMNYLKIWQPAAILLNYKLPYIVGWIQERPIPAPGSRTTYLGARLKNALSRRPVQEWPISAPGPRTTYLGGRLKNDLSRRPVEERPISAPDSRTTYLKRDFCFSDSVVAALRDFKIRLL